MTAASLPAGHRFVLADVLPGARVRDVVLVLAGAGFTGLAAQVSIHTSLTPVPFTLQTFAVLVTGAALGTIRGMVSMLVYVVAGTAGVPWFEHASHGWGGPSFGYIVGFIVAAGAVGALARRGNDRDVLSTVGLMALGSALVYLVGATWLAHDLGVSAGRAVELGVTPFLLGDAIKVAVAALILPATWRLVRR